MPQPSKSPNVNTPGVAPVPLPKPYPTNQTLTFKNGAKFRVIKQPDTIPKQLGTRYV